jgi:hypothetical protein
VVVEPRDLRQGKTFVSRLGERLAHDTAHVQEVFFRIDTSSLEGKKLLYLSPADLQSLHDNLAAYQDVVRELVTAPGLNLLARPAPLRFRFITPLPQLLPHGIRLAVETFSCYRILWSQEQAPH